MPLTATAPRAKAPRRRRARRSKSARTLSGSFQFLLPLAMILGMVVIVVAAKYTVSFRSPLRVRLQWPVVLVPKTVEETTEAQSGQWGHRLTAYQQYTCNKFGSACRTALAVQRAENPRGECEIYHYNSDGTIDWGYFQINTVHLKRAGVNLRDLLDCKANIDFAYQLYTEQGFEPWSTYKSGAYLAYLRTF